MKKDLSGTFQQEPIVLNLNFASKAAKPAEPPAPSPQPTAATGRADELAVALLERLKSGSRLKPPSAKSVMRKLARGGQPGAPRVFVDLHRILCKLIRRHKKPTGTWVRGADGTFEKCLSLPKGGRQ